jgi:hypothetical protein
MKNIFLLVFLALLAGCDQGCPATQENWILSRRVMTKGLLYGPATPAPISAFSSKQACLDAAAAVVEVGAVQISIDPPEFESQTKIFNFECRTLTKI